MADGQAVNCLIPVLMEVGDVYKRQREVLEMI